MIPIDVSWRGGAQKRSSEFTIEPDDGFGLVLTSFYYGTQKIMNTVLFLVVGFFVFLGFFS